LLKFFFFNDTATTEIYTLSLHDALPISLLQLCRLYKSRIRPFHWPAFIHVDSIYWARYL